MSKDASKMSVPQSKNRRELLLAKHSRKRNARLVCGVSSPRNCVGKAFFERTRRYTASPVCTPICRREQRDSALSSISPQSTIFFLAVFKWVNAATSSWVTGEKWNARKYTVSAVKMRKFCARTFSSGNSARKNCVLRSHESKARWVSSLFFSVSSERFRKYRFLRCIRYAPIPSVVRAEQIAPSSTDGINRTPIQRKSTTETRNESSNVKRISEIKAVFFIFAFLPVFLRFNLEKRENILYNVVK